MTSGHLPDRTVDAIAERYVEQAAALHPVQATYYGVAGHDDRLPDLSPDGYDARDGLTRKTLADLRDAPPVDERERVAREAMIERLALQVEMADAGIPRSQISVTSSAVTSLRGAFDLMPTEGEEAIANIDARLAAVPEALAGFRATLLESADRGRVSAKRQYSEIALQLRRWTGQDGTTGDVFAKLVDSLDADGAMAESLARHAAEASAAMADFGRFVGEELGPRGRDREAVGRDEYALCNRSFLGATVDLDETYHWGWAELKRLHDEMVATSDRIVPGGSVDEAIAALNADPTRMVEGRERFRDWMQELSDRTVAEMADVHFDIPEPIRSLECRLAPTNDGGIYYTPPSEDFSRPGRMWWSVPDGIDTFSTWQETTTVFHEGVPGHHLQCAQTLYRDDILNRWQRAMCWVSGHGEGWALYSERLMDDLGYLADPGDKLGMLDMQAFRAARVIVDIGMHLELEIPRDNPFGFHPGEIWTPQLGLDFMRERSSMDDEFIKYEVLRYLGWPGQAPSYKVGERIWLECRDEVKARRGAAFDLKQFHTEALNLGSLGLDPFRAAMARL
ncbi:DUF885 domain-containing protein [Nocardioides agariphilus]|jgi:uncharacterized protein (DUF885 family)|uniref:DUF885 domain-containing protein n=1 Tax=Nocardioides agariphilus TaxID=433664 RepID=A0A930VK08_9ACTN|nr:DUF885 domain-containing protein [Nocardioides agariphilus]MBF4768093.1 DUF885 domain-containing protein [Nocardioides agariphilus]